MDVHFLGIARGIAYISLGASLLCLVNTIIAENQSRGVLKNRKEWIERNRENANSFIPSIAALLSALALLDTHAFVRLGLEQVR